MSRFEDPLQTASVELPAGWVFDPFSSSLTRLVFIHWARPLESLSIALYPPRLPGGAGENAWRDEIAAGLPPGTVLTRLAAGEGPALAADLHGKIHTRVAFIRGARLDATVEHRATTDDAETMALLPRALATLEIPPNRAGVPGEPLDAASRCQRTAHAELEAGATGQAFATLRHAKQIACDHWLASLVAPEREPDLLAVESVVTTLAESALFAGDLKASRDAEHIATRVRRSLADLPISPEQASLAEQRWTALRQALVRQQSGLMGLKEPESSPRSLIGMRGFHLLRQGQQASVRGDLGLAAAWGGAALGDLLLELAKLGQDHFVPLPDDKAAALAEAVGDQRRIVAPGACQAAELSYCFAMDRQDARTARETASLMTEVTALPAEGEATDADRRAHAMALMWLAGALLFTADAATLAQADRLMVAAGQIIDGLPDDPSLIAEFCRNHAWLKYYQQDMKAGAALCAKALAALDRLPGEPVSPGDQRMRRAVGSLQSQFLLGGDDLIAAEAAARSAVEGVAQPISSNLLNLALVLDKAGRRPEALVQLRRAFEVALPDNPLGQDVLRLLFVASVWMEPVDRAASLHLHAAAEALLDAQRLQFDTDDEKIAFDENSNHLEIAQTLVGRLIDAGDLGGALAAADRGRARILVDLLGPHRQRRAPPGLPPPPLLDVDPLRALRAAGDFVTACAARVFQGFGAPMPLDVAGILQTVRMAGRPALVIQPERGRVQLFCVLPEDAVLIATSPVPMDEIIAAMNAAQGALGVFATARSRAGGKLVLADVDDAVPALDLALATLSAALIAPLTELLSKGGLLNSVIGPRGLIIVPYRELALVPYALLRTPDGNLLIEQAPLVLVPSLAALASLQMRPRREGHACAVIGDPHPDPAFHLAPLPAAAEEAHIVAALLARAGIPPTLIALRLGPDATTASYRRDAADATLLHLSCHAAAQEPANRSALYLTPTATNDGQLMPHEISDVALSDALVFLSACQTGLGRPTADGVIGLGRAFLEAGALAVVVSLWRVVDVAALAMADHFYRALLGIECEAADASTALQRAMLATRAALRAGQIRTEAGEVLDDHPAHWAPFMLTGDGALWMPTRAVSSKVPA